MRLFAFALLAASAAGCNRVEPPPVMNPVTGTVLYDGKAAKGVKVFLIPTSAPMPPAIPQNPHGVTDDQGRFTISTHGGNDGAAEGGYQVVLSWPTAEDGSEAEVQDRFLTWYDPAHSTLTAIVKTGTNDLPAYRIPVISGPPGKMNGIPGRN